MAQMCADKRRRLRFLPIRVYLRHPRLNSFLWVAGAAGDGSMMEHRVMSSSELGGLLGSRGAASEILHGKRGISKMHMAKLAAHFRVDAGVFLEKHQASGA
jgi:hypothetical protein